MSDPIKILARPTNELVQALLSYHKIEFVVSRSTEIASFLLGVVGGLDKGLHMGGTLFDPFLQNKVFFFCGHAHHVF